MFKILFYSLTFILGTCIGSFLNSVIYRIWEEKSFLRGRSFCPKCKHTLGFADLVPIFSFLSLRGKCRYCKEKISLQYPLIELITGLLFVFVVDFIFLNPELFPSFSQSVIAALFYWFFVSILVIVFIYDLKHYLIPDGVVYLGILGAFGLNLIQDFLFNHSTIQYFSTLFTFKGLISGILASGFFLAIVLFSRGKWMGLGDVKFAFFMGMLLKLSAVLLGLFLAFFIGAIIGIGIVLFGKKKFKDEIPFGPFLVTGTFFALFFANQIISWYFNLFI